MSIDRIYYCDGPDCGGDGGLRGGATSVHAQTGTPPPYLPRSFMALRGDRITLDEERHFCSWDCLMKYAAARPSDTVVAVDDLSD